MNLPDALSTLQGWLPPNPADDTPQQAAARVVVAETERFREHSEKLNTVGWRLSDALGDIPEGVDEHRGDGVEVLVDRVIARLEGTDEAYEDAYVAGQAALIKRLRSWCDREDLSTPDTPEAAG